MCCMLMRHDSLTKAVRDHERKSLKQNSNREIRLGAASTGVQQRLQVVRTAGINVSEPPVVKKKGYISQKIINAEQAR